MAGHDTIRAPERPSRPDSRSDGRGDAELTLRTLRVFVAVEETGSVGRAAERLGGSPSGVSQQITALEQAVGAKLFDRRARPATLTPAGQVLRVHAHRILDAAAKAQAELAELNLAALPQLSLAIIDDLDASLTPVLVAQLQRRFRNCFINVFSGRSDVVTARYERREADIAVSAVLPDEVRAYRCIPLLRESFILVVAKGILRPEVDILEQLMVLPFVQYSESMPIGRIIAQHMMRARFSPPRRYAFEASRSVFAMALQDGGWALTTPLGLLDAQYLAAEFEIRPAPFPNFSRTIYMIVRVNELGHLPEELARYCRDLVAREIVPRFEELAPCLNAIVVSSDGQ